MKKLRLFSIAGLLSLALAVSAYAGDITAMSSHPAYAGDITTMNAPPTPATLGTGLAGTVAMEAVLSILQSVLSVF